MGPTSFEPGEGKGTPWHPHRGFETVTYLLDGEAEHRDSMGNHGFLRPGDTQWMTAGAGVLHQEGPSAAAQRDGGSMHGLQLWVNLPAQQKMIEPAYQDITADHVARRSESGAEIRVIAGDLFDLSGPGSTHTPIAYAHLTLDAGASATTTLATDHTVLVYPMTGAARVGDTEIAEGVLAVIDGTELTVTGVAGRSEVIVLTGQPLHEPVARYGPFVMNTQAELRQAMVDFDHGRFGSPTT